MKEDNQIINTPTFDLKLPEFKVLECKENDNGDYLYVLEPLDRPTVCPYCQGTTIHVQKKQHKHVHDCREFNHRVGLLIEGKIYICKDCNSIINPIYPSIQGRLTKRLIKAIEEESLNRPFRDIAREYAISDTTVANIFNDYVKRLYSKYVLECPEVLGIDEVHLDKKYYGVFVKVDKDNGTVIEMTESRSKKTVEKVLKSLQNPENLKCVTMDMWAPYRDAVAEVFPEIPVVIDRFHVIKTLNKSFDEVRAKIVRKLTDKKERISLKHNRFVLLANGDKLTPKQKAKLDEILEAYPEFVETYQLKEAFRHMYDYCNDRETAEAYFETLVTSCHESEITAFDEYIDTVNNWKKEIFNYFDQEERKTNAQTESLNNIIKEIAGSGRGYSFETLRMKVIFHQKQSKTLDKFDFNSFK